MNPKIKSFPENQEFHQKPEKLLESSFYIVFVIYQGRFIIAGNLRTYAFTLNAYKVLVDNMTQVVHI